MKAIETITFEDNDIKGLTVINYFYGDVTDTVNEADLLDELEQDLNGNILRQYKTSEVLPRIGYIGSKLILQYVTHSGKQYLLRTWFARLDDEITWIKMTAWHEIIKPIEVDDLESFYRIKLARFIAIGNNDRGETLLNAIAVSIPNSTRYNISDMYGTEEQYDNERLQCFHINLKDRFIADFKETVTICRERFKKE